MRNFAVVAFGRCDGLRGSFGSFEAAERHVARCIRKGMNVAGATARIYEYASERDARHGDIGDSIGSGGLLAIRASW